MRSAKSEHLADFRSQLFKIIRLFAERSERLSGGAQFSATRCPLDGQIVIRLILFPDIKLRYYVIHTM